MIQLLTPQQISEMLQLPLRKTSELVKRPSFPAPAINESQKLRRWTMESVEGWIKQQEKRNA